MRTAEQIADAILNSVSVVTEDRDWLRGLVVRATLEGINEGEHTGPEYVIASEITALREAIEAATAPPAVDVAAVHEAPPPPLAGWAYLELMGRRVLPAAWVEEDNIVGRPMLRVRRLVRADRPAGLGEPTPPLVLEERFRIYSPATVYSIEWITEAEARERWLAWNGSRLDDGDDIPF